MALHGRLHISFLKVMCCDRCAMGISKRGKLSVVWGKRCAMRWGKFILRGVSYNGCS